MTLPAHVSRGLAAPFESFNRDVAMLNRFFNSGSTEAVGHAVDIREDAEQFVVDAELPGFKKCEVDITLENQRLTITAERRLEQSEYSNPQETPTYLLNERRSVPFYRAFKLPPTADEKSVSARLDNGVLTITIRKREETKPRKIVVG